MYLLLYLTFVLNINFPSSHILKRWRSFLLKNKSFSGGGYHETSIKSSLCHLCRAVLSNQNALRYHLNYVHGIHGEVTTSPALMQTYSVTNSVSSTPPNSSLSVPNLSSNNKSQLEVPNQNNFDATKIKHEEH